MDKALYQRYVQTDCWNLRRGSYLRIKESCECCGRVVGRALLQVHHLTYERFGHELDDDLFALCEFCHRLMHGIEGATDADLALSFLTAQQSLFPSAKLSLVIEIVTRMKRPRPVTAEEVRRELRRG